MEACGAGDRSRREPVDSTQIRRSQDMTERGGVLREGAASESERSGEDQHAQALPTPPPGPQWYALYTRSHCEQLVHDQLAFKGFAVFLPKMDVWSRRGGVQHRIAVPMFPGYLFLHHAMDKASYIEAHKARGLVRILGERWDRLSVVPNAEIEAIQRVLAARMPVLPHPYLREGQRVCITRGPLAGVEGILVRTLPSKGLLVLSIELLQRSIAVEIDCTMVGAA
jgi:transcription antitermination factor NusG